jgi:hypothetical protein
MTEHSPDCFVDIARAFKGGRLSFEEFLDRNLEHFAGLRHKEDAINTVTKIIDLSWEGPMGPISAAMNLCILDPSFNRRQVSTLLLLLNVLNKIIP